MRIEIVHDSVVFQDCDAIVNAANVTLLGGGGVDGAMPPVLSFIGISTISDALANRERQ